MPAPHASLQFSRTQRGVALVVALILLIVITLVGLAAVGGTIMQNKMASNQYDREVAFQNAESALRIAEARIISNPSDIARNCQSGGTTCLDNPFDDPNLLSSKIHTLPTSAYAAQSNATGQPQYVIESMGHWINFSSDTGYNRTANAAQYGAQGKSSTAMYYRITVRSGDPAKVGDRAVVTLQTVIRQG
jgi:type IV pilus assembly protein PilX